MPVDFQSAALTLLERGWLAIPLALDSQGFPKKPISDGWTSLPLSEDAVRSLAWREAVGIGIVLGPVSGNLAVIDIDHPGMAEATFGLLDTRAVRTIRKRGHIYVKEYFPSPSRRLQVDWEGAKVGIEFKGAGNQVAAPPTPGYSLVNKAWPMHVRSIDDAWQSIANQLPGLNIENGKIPHANYPPAWREHVPIDERNKSAYVEAHRLREAKMPIDQAMKYMHLRWQADYEPGNQEWPEIERTIESAYNSRQVRGFL